MDAIYVNFRYLNEELRHSTQYNFKLLGTRMFDCGGDGGSSSGKQHESPVKSDHRKHQKGMKMRKNSVRGAIRRASHSGPSKSPPRFPGRYILVRHCLM